MVKFEVECGKLLKFLEVCACKGTIWIGADTGTSQKISANLFTAFALEVTEEGLEVVAVDKYTRKVYEYNNLYEVNVIEEGAIDISDIDIILNTLKIIPSMRAVVVEEVDGKLVLVSEDADSRIKYEITQEINAKDLAVSKRKAEEARDMYTFSDEGEPTITAGGQSAKFSTMIQITADEIKRIFTGAVKITDGDSIKIALHDDGIEFKLGRANSKNKGSEYIKRQITNPIEIERGFDLLQTIFGNIVGDTKLYFRVSTKGNMFLWARAEGFGIIQNYNLGQRTETT